MLERLHEVKYLFLVQSPVRDQPYNQAFLFILVLRSKLGHDCLELCIRIIAFVNLFFCHYNHPQGCKYKPHGNLRLIIINKFLIVDSK